MIDASQPRFTVLPLMALAAAAAASCLAGCSKPAVKEISTAENSNLKPLSILYGKYETQNANRAPPSEAEFKKYIQTKGQDTLVEFNTDIEKVFVSERDGEPFVVFYRGNELPDSGVIAFEREGVDGNRVVAYPFGSVSLVDEYKFQQLVPNPP